MSGTFTPGQLEAISCIERACSVLSLLGLVFYASFGNMMSNVGTLISRTYIDSPGFVGCQLQAFLVQMFMPADAYWTLAMAFNVYLTFYHKYDSRRLRSMETLYLTLCYGVAFIPAFVYLFVKNSEGRRVYGNATLWCWISTDWDTLRIVTFYAPVWIVIIVTFSIYIRAGRTIYQRRKELNGFHSTDPDPVSVNGEGFNPLKTTMVTVTSECATELEEFRVQDEEAARRLSVAPPSSRGTNGAYSVHIVTGPTGPGAAASLSIPGTPMAPTTPTAPTISTMPRTPNPRRRHRELNNAAWAYTKCSILFFTVLLLTWIPSSANRVYSVIHENEINVPLQFMGAFVLPLQGFWNAVIYAVTSWGACKGLVSDLVSDLASGVGLGGRAGGKGEASGGGGGGGVAGGTSSPGEAGGKGRDVPRLKQVKSFDESSTVELTKSRSVQTDGEMSS